jgi:hypothetical protein
VRPHDTSRRHAGHLVRLAGLRRECVAIRAARAAHDAVVIVARLASGILPRPVIGHRAFDGEHAAVVVGDDQVEWLAWWRVVCDQE